MRKHVVFCVSVLLTVLLFVDAKMSYCDIISVDHPIFGIGAITRDTSALKVA